MPARCADFVKSRCLFTHSFKKIAWKTDSATTKKPVTVSGRAVRTLLMALYRGPSAGDVIAACGDIKQETFKAMPYKTSAKLLYGLFALKMPVT